MSEKAAAEAKEVGQFFASQWNVYERLVRANLLFHKELFGALREDLLALPPGFSLLDLASGDAGSLAKALAGMRVSRCVAVDLAGGPVLLAARDNLRFRGIPAEVIQAEFLEYVSAPAKKPFDVVTLSYSLHHLATVDKARFFKGLASCLKPGGTFWLLEEIIPPGIDRAEWLQRQLEMMHRLGGNVLTAAEWAGVDNHISTCDIPEHAEAYEKMALDAGFAGMEIRLLVADGLAGMMRFKR